MKLRVLASVFALGIACGQVHVQAAPYDQDDLRKQVEDAINRAVDPVVKRQAEQRIFPPFLWSYSFDGTDASLLGATVLSGGSLTGAEPQIALSFKCSRHWVRISVSSNEFGKDGPKNFFLNLDRGILFDRRKFGDNNVAVSISDSPDPVVVRAVSKLTRSLFIPDESRIELVTPEKRALYRIQKSDNEKYEQRNDIAKFREKCSGWWSEF